MTRREAIERAAAGAGSHGALAAVLGVTPTTLSRWKTGAGGTLWHWQTIARLALVRLEDIGTTHDELVDAIVDAGIPGELT